ncbi:MAG: hypothetical protein K2Q26_07815 [Bdellovibrionales bacterium]|nr:hypothetical protein [Bdellovibrionales bacterium]
MKYKSLKECLIAFGEDYEIQFNEIESFAGKSLIYYIEGSEQFQRPWRLWITHDKLNNVQVVVDNVDTNGEEHGISFTCVSFDVVYDRLRVAYSLAIASNSLNYKNDQYFENSEELKKFASEDSIQWVPKSLIRFRTGHLHIVSQNNPISHWRVWIQDRTLFLAQNGFKRSSKTLTSKFMSFKTSPLNKDELLKVIIFAARIAD